MSAGVRHAEERAAAGQGWPDHIRATLRIGVPLIAAQLAQMAVGVTDTVMLGWLGAKELAASVLGTTFFFLASKLSPFP